jgi:hypothetical protein
MGAAAGEAAHKDKVDPEAWAIVDGKLYLTHMRQAMDDWRQNPRRIHQTSRRLLDSGQGSNGAGNSRTALRHLATLDRRRAARRRSHGHRRPRGGA